MRAWCVIAPRSEGERIRRDLKDRGLLHKRLRIRHEGGMLWIPTAERVDIGLPTDERDFDEGYVPVRSYKDVVEVPEGVRRSLPSSFDVIGDIAVLKIREEISSHRDAIGRAVLRWNPNIRVVVQDRGVKGARRVRQIEVIAGEPRTTTVHVEHGLRYRVDLATAYFSPRLASERARISALVQPGETVADPFAGVGPYAILITRRRAPRIVHASDANPAAVDLLRANVAANRAERVLVQDGDARTVLREVSPADRVILDLPHTALEFLPDAFEAIGSRGSVHLYRILERSDEPQALDTIRAAADHQGLAVAELKIRHVRAYSPTQHHTAFDITVVRG